MPEAFALRACQEVTKSCLNRTLPMRGCEDVDEGKQWLPTENTLLPHLLKVRFSLALHCMKYFSPQDTRQKSLSDSHPGRCDKLCGRRHTGQLTVGPALARQNSFQEELSGDAPHFQTKFKLNYLPRVFSKIQQMHFLYLEYFIFIFSC